MFSSAVIEFNKKKGHKKSLDLISKFSGEFDVIIMEAIDFLENRNVPKPLHSGEQENDKSLDEGAGDLDSNSSQENKKKKPQKAADCTVQ